MGYRISSIRVLKDLFFPLFLTFAVKSGSNAEKIPEKPLE